jgi:hypothetical protein
VAALPPPAATPPPAALPPPIDAEPPPLPSPPPAPEVHGDAGNDQSVHPVVIEMQYCWQPPTVVREAPATHWSVHVPIGTQRPELHTCPCAQGVVSVQSRQPVDRRPHETVALGLEHVIVPTPHWS